MAPIAGLRLPAGGQLHHGLAARAEGAGGRGDAQAWMDVRRDIRRDIRRDMTRGVVSEAWIDVRRDIRRDMSRDMTRGVVSEAWIDVRRDNSRDPQSENDILGEHLGYISANISANISQARGGRDNCWDGAGQGAEMVEDCSDATGSNG